MEQIGTLSLCLLMAAKQRSLDLLRETLREIGHTLTEKEGLRAYRTVALDLDQPAKDWLKGQMLKLYDNHAARRTPYTAYLWQRAEEKPLSGVVTFRLTGAEIALLEQRAKAAGVSRSEYARQLFRTSLTSD